MARAVATKYSSHFTSAVMAGLFAVAVKRHFGAVQGDLSGITPDELVILTLLPAIIFASLFGLGHFFLRQSGLRATAAYPLLGAIVTVIASVTIFSTEFLETALADGILSLLALLAAGAGSLIGFLHVRSAGYEHDPTEPEQLARTVRPAKAWSQAGGRTHADATSESLAADAELGHIRAGEDEFFDGPLQVATNGKAVAVAAMIGGLVHAAYSALWSGLFSGSKEESHDRLLDQFWNGELASNFGTGLIFSVVICLIILPPAIYGVHKFLQARERITVGSYVKYGAAAPIALGLLMFIVGIFMTHWLILPLAAAMGVYRNLAGLEPADLPEDIEVRDRRTLVGSNHVRRRTHRIVN